MIKRSRKKKMLKDLSNIAKYLEQAGFVEQAKEIKNVMAALDGQFVIDPYPIPDAQRNIENQGYMGGDGVAGGYSLLHTPMVGQADDEEYEDEWWDLMGISFNIRKGKEIAKNHSTISISLSSPPEFAGLSHVDKEYAMTTDLSKPLLLGVLATPQDGEITVLLDGHHRFQKAKQTGISTLSAKKLSFDETMSIMSDGLAKTKMIEAVNKLKGKDQKNDDQRQQWEDDLLDIFKSFDGQEKDVYEDKGDIYSLFQFDDKAEADMAFKALMKHPAHNIHFESTTPYRPQKDAFHWYIGLREYGPAAQNNIDMLAASNGLRGNTVTDDQNAGMFQGFSDSYFYTDYTNLDHRYKIAP